MLLNLLRRGGPLLASALVVAATATSLRGPDPVQRLVASPWFVGAGGVVAAASLLAAVTAIRRRSIGSTLQHVGLVIALAGVAVNQTSSRSGYLFLEQGAGDGNFTLSRNLRLAEELPQPLALDSITSVTAKAFRPALVAWVSSAGRSRRVTYNRPLLVAGRQILLSQIAAPGFLAAYEVRVDSSDYLLLHNQISEARPGLVLSSTGYDAAAGRIELMLGSEKLWLGADESATVQGHIVKLLSATFAPNVGAIFIVNDVRYRFVIFIGFGLALLGLLPPLIRREVP